MSQSALVS